MYAYDVQDSKEEKREREFDYALNENGDEEEEDDEEEDEEEEEENPSNKKQKKEGRGEVFANDFKFRVVGL